MRLAETFVPPIIQSVPGVAAPPNSFCPFYPLQGTTTALKAKKKRYQFLGRFRRTKKTTNDSSEPTPVAQSKPTRRGPFRKRLAKTILTATLMSSTLFGAQAQAAPRQGRAVSVRPGMTSEQIEAVRSGENVDEILEQLDKQQAERTAEARAKAAKKAKAIKASFDDYGDAIDEDDAILMKEVGNTLEAKEGAAALEEGLRDQLAGEYQEASRLLYLKVGAVFFIPTYGSLMGREFFRRRSEAAYIEKGLEVLKRQKAEYFNVTETTSDSDIEDELKGLKNETSSEDDDDDDDEDDEDDDDEDDDDTDDPPPRRKPPSGPKGNGGGPDMGGAGGPDNGYGKPNEDDLDRLNKIFGKS